MTEEGKQVIEIQRKAAAKQYDECRKIYDVGAGLMMRESKKVIMAEMTVYAGIHNRDYAQYKKGVDQFEKRIKASALYVGHNAAVGGGRAEILDGCTDMKKLYEGKLRLFKDFYNALPRGYFRSG